MMTSQNEIKKVLNNQGLRKALALKSHFWFFHIYLSHYIKFPSGFFHHKMFQVTQDEKIRTAVMVAFRGSAKSTIFSLSYPIWAVLGNQRKKFVIVCNQTQQQAKLTLSNIKKEFETNNLLRRDFGKLETLADEWRADSLVLPQFKARISAFSAGESIRGIRHLTTRPDVIICDDVEDLQTVKNKEMRDKIDQWLRGEVIPAGDKGTKLIIVGNLLHEDSLIKRLENDIQQGKFDGIFLAYPLIDEEGNIAWPGKFPDKKAIKQLRKTMGNDSAWYREYLLKIIADQDRIIHSSWIGFYDKLPNQSEKDFKYVGIGGDLAISENPRANFTAFVAAQIHGSEEDLKIYILPHPTNKRMDFPTTKEELIKTANSLGSKSKVRIFIEDVSYQRSLIQELTRKGFLIEGVTVSGRNKAERLTFVSPYVKNKKVLFPKKGAEELIRQIVNFGLEKYDDLADAFSILIEKIIDNDKPFKGPISVALSGFYKPVRIRA